MERSRASSQATNPRLLVVGAGPAGIFAAIRARELAPTLRVDVMEAQSHPLSKVVISGGGRCNVTHACFDAGHLVQFYPRGQRALRSVFTRFGPADTVRWFESRGVRLKTEADGRIFPVSDDARTIAACLMDAARDVGVTVHLGQTVRGCEGRGGAPAPSAPDAPVQEGFRLHTAATTWEADFLLLASGSARSGYEAARSLGHSIVAPVPSLFSFDVRDARLVGLAGVSVPRVVGRLQVAGHPLVVQEGPLLVTHRGLSGPVVLRLSAWGARALHDANYQATMLLDFFPDENQEALRTRLHAQKAATPKRHVDNEIPVDLPRRLWTALCGGAAIPADQPWGQVPQAALNRLTEQLKRAPFQITGKGPFKDEFVTAGGVPTDEVDMRTMQSRQARGLYLAGEILDVDALTGGFNFQNAWSTGWIAGETIAAEAAHFGVSSR